MRRVALAKRIEDSRTMLATTPAKMNPTQKQFSMNRAASKKQFPVIYFKTEVAENPVKE